MPPVKPGVVARRSQVLAAEQADRSHLGRRTLARLEGIFATTVNGDRIEPLAGAFEDLVADVQPSHVGALQGHHLPTDHGGVAQVFGIVAPAAVRVLGLENVVHCPLRRLANLPVAAEPVGF